MTNLMNEMIREASKTASVAGLIPGYSERNISTGTLTLGMIPVNTNGRQMLQKVWRVNGKRIAAAKLAATA